MATDAGPKEPWKNAQEAAMDWKQEGGCMLPTKCCENGNFGEAHDCLKRPRYTDAEIRKAKVIGEPNPWIEEDEWIMERARVLLGDVDGQVYGYGMLWPFLKHAKEFSHSDKGTRLAGMTALYAAMSTGQYQLGDLLMRAMAAGLM